MAYWTARDGRPIVGRGARHHSNVWTITKTDNTVRLADWNVIAYGSDPIMFQSDNFNEAKEVFRQYANMIGAFTDDLDTIVVPLKE